jgi:hypothetical protein
MKLSLVIVLFFQWLLWGSLAWAQVQFDYTVLRTKDPVEMGALIAKTYAGFQSEMTSDFDPRTYSGEFVSAMRIAFSRPDYDSSRSNFFAPTRRLLHELNILHGTLESLVEEAIAGAQNVKKSPMDRTTYLVVLENIIYEFKPNIATDKRLRSAIEKIGNAKITIDEKTRKFQLLRSMTVMTSPSVLANNVLRSVPIKVSKPSTAGDPPPIEEQIIDFDDDSSLKPANSADEKQIKNRSQRK